MSRIRVKNFGPIREGLKENDGWIEIKKVTVFIGDQGSGKSTLAKLISTFTWIEKALVNGVYRKSIIQRKNKLLSLLKYHRLEGYFNDSTYIEYEGEAYGLKYEDGILTVCEHKQTYMLPQIMYVPAERNFITYFKTAKELKLSAQSLQEFLTEFNNAKAGIKGNLALPINKVDLEYDKLNDTLNIKNTRYKLKLSDASSGFQSLVPLYLVSYYLANSVKKQSQDINLMSEKEKIMFRKAFFEIITNKEFSDEQKRIATSTLTARFNKTAFINIVEEPEQNLFPTSQRAMLFSLLELNNMNVGNKLIITTHSPYVINDITLAVKTKLILDKVKDNKKATKALNDIIPIVSTIDPEELKIYELDEIKGTVVILEKYQGLPSDDNYLNEKLEESNDIFQDLLELENSI